ncbi:fimbrial protein [Salmonella enterica]|nr:fimbrial protein [Salmonella enterica]EKS4859763.1 fimbrial protein [Salmonella enterica]EKS4878918.1 fimbrial protein [Salmonella enterica]EKS4883531.1 fimbrial protein [Salmonella enterica]EKS5970723.1 fimbrial protein [Salmonella enterica]
MTTQILRKTRNWLMPLLLAGVVVCAQAGGTKTVDMTLHLVVTQPPPCTLEDLHVEFPDGYIDDIDLSSTLFHVPIHCDIDTSNYYSYIKLQIQGNATTIGGDQVLQTSEPNLGIRIEDSNAVVPINTGWVYMRTTPTEDGEFMIIARLVQRFPGEVFSPGEFSANATMILDYE